MSLSKSDFEKLNERLKKITEQKVEEIDIATDYPPTIELLEDNNKTYSIRAAILFVDIRKSTYLTETSQAKSMVKIYRSFMRMAVECVRKNGGVTRQFSGDRIMGVFLDTINSDTGEIIAKAVDKAIETARCLQTTVDYSLNKHLKNNVNGKTIECGIGIDFGKVLVTQVGMYGLEHDESKENEIDCVWVGNTTNHASKYSDLASGGEIFISESVYNNLSNSYKQVWTEAAKYKGSRAFLGYITSNYYLDYAEELGTPTKAENDHTSEIDTYGQLAEGIKEIERLQQKLIAREKELAILEEQLRRKNEMYATECAQAKEDQKKARALQLLAEKNLRMLKENYFSLTYKIINFAHCEPVYVQSFSQELWDLIINKAFTLGAQLGYSDDEIKSKLDCGLIAIYRHYELYEKAYDVIVTMAKTNTVWVNLDGATLKWAKENYKLHSLINAIERRLVNYTVSYEHRKTFEQALQTVKALRGF